MNVNLRQGAELATICVGFLAVLTFLGVRGCDDDTETSRPTQSPPQYVTTPTPVPSTVDPSPTRTATPSLPPTTQVVPPPPTTVDGIAVEAAALQGRRVGPNLFQFDGNLDFGLGYSWIATAGGVAVNSNSCQIIARVTGPQSFPAVRTDECSRDIGSPFNGGINSERITEPGDYTVTVTDELTGTTGVTKFRLLPA